MGITRRKFLQTAARVGAGLTIFFDLPELTVGGADVSAFEPNAYLRITSDDTVTLWVTRSEMGQGVRTNLPAALAEELEIDLAQVKLEQAMPGKRFKGIRLRTSGSGSSSSTFTALRKAGASAREMLITAAAQAWSVDRSECRATLGLVIHTPTGRKLRYGEVVERAAVLPIPANPPLKDPKDFRLIGKPLKRVDSPAIVNGSAGYGCDVRVPQMLVAVMARCPYLGGSVAHFDARNALAMPGVRHVVPIRAGISTGVAVVADNTWTAMKARKALRVDWHRGANSSFDSNQFMRRLEAAFNETGYPLRREGNAAEMLKTAAKRLEAAVYEFPFQVHAPMETMNCTADVRKDSCEIWVPTQTPDTAHTELMKTLGLPSEGVKIHTTLLGGGFGRRLILDYVQEAVELSKAIAKPVQLIWDRADDIRHGSFHPASLEKLQAGLDANGRIVSWIHKSVGSDLSTCCLPTEEQKKDPQYYANNESPWGAFDTPYNFSNLTVDYVPVDSPVPTGAWRAVMYPSRVFGRECFLDEVANAAGHDPLQLRIDLLQPGNIFSLGEQKIDRGRMIQVLEAAREKSGWAKPLARDEDRLRGRGLAINIYFGDSYIAEVAEVSVARDLSNLRVDRIVCVSDCGLVINPTGLEAQVESGVTWGLSATLHGKIDFRNGGAVQQNYSDFEVLRIDEMPRVEAYFVPSGARPSGFGEHPVPPVAPAVANAVFAATGKRIRSLPITADKIRL